MKIKKCMCKNCSYNKDNKCVANAVEIEGLFSRSRLGTFCTTFTKGEHVNVPSNIIEQTVKCSANYCIFNKCNTCYNESSVITDENAKFRTETQCGSFRLR